MHDYFYPHMLWFNLNLVFSKLKIGINKIFTLKEENKMSGKIKLKPDKLEKIFT